MTVTKKVLFANNAQSTLAGDISSSATTANLASGAGALFPNPSTNECFFLTFVDALTGNVNEIVMVTNMTGDTITTMVRGQEGTSAKPWLAGDTAAQYVTAGDLQNLAQPRDTQSQAGNYGVDSGSANALVITLPVGPANLTALVGTDVRVTKNGADNTGGVTINVNALGPVPIVDIAGNPLAAGALPGGGTFTLIYDGTHFVLQSSVPSNAVSGRILLAGGMTFYVATTGNDSNDGLTSGTPWLTLQHAWNVIFQNYDLAGFNVVVTVADGTYANGVLATGRPPGADTMSSITFQSTSGNPAACIINDASGAAFSAGIGAGYTITGFKIITSAGNALDVSAGGQINHSNLQFGTCSGAHMFAWNGGRIYVEGNYTINGGANQHIDAARCGQIFYDSPVTTVTVTGTPAFANEFALSTDGGNIYVDSGVVTFSGSATGTRYISKVNAVIETNGGGANYFPGSIAGSVANGGVYV